MQKILLLFSQPEDEELIGPGITLFRDFHVAYESRCLSAELDPKYCQEQLDSFQQQGGELLLCVTSPQDPLPTFAAAFSPLPLLWVASREEPYGFSQPQGALPLARLGSGPRGLAQAALFALQILARKDQKLEHELQLYRQSLGAQMIALDQKHRVIFNG